MLSIIALVEFEVLRMMSETLAPRLAGIVVGSDLTIGLAAFGALPAFLAARRVTT